MEVGPQPIPDVLRRALRELVHELATGSFTTLESDGRAGKLPKGYLGHTLGAYGHALAELPEEGFSPPHAGALLVEGAWEEGEEECSTADHSLANEAGWVIDLPLWTADGRSELVLQVYATMSAGRVSVEIEELHTP